MKKIFLGNLDNILYNIYLQVKKKTNVVVGILFCYIFSRVYLMKYEMIYVWNKVILI